MKRALFLDRDGIVNVDKGHVFRIEDIEFVDGIFELVGNARAVGLMVVIVTNQSGIARGMYTENEFLRLTHWMDEVFVKRGSPIDAVYFCPTHPDFPNERLDSVYRGWRKPNPGMLLEAASKHGIDLTRSFIIGDRWTDAEAGIQAGLERALVISSGAHVCNDLPRVDVVPTLPDAWEWLIRQLIP